MDLLSLDLNAAGNAGAWVEILHPVTREPIGVRIKLLGQESDVVRALLEQQDRERLQQLKRDRKPEEITAQQKARADAILVAATADWQSYTPGQAVPEQVNAGVVTFGGEPLTCTPENVRKVYNHPGLGWLRLQVDEEIANRANFLRG